MIINWKRMNGKIKSDKRVRLSLLLWEQLSLLLWRELDFPNFPILSWEINRLISIKSQERFFIILVIRIRVVCISKVTATTSWFRRLITYLKLRIPKTYPSPRRINRFRIVSQLELIIFSQRKYHRLARFITNVCILGWLLVQF